MAEISLDEFVSRIGGKLHHNLAGYCEMPSEGTSKASNEFPRWEASSGRRRELRRCN